MDADDADIDLDTQELSKPLSHEPLGYGPGEWASTASEGPDPTAAPVAKAQMLIRRPVEDVFKAFIDPAITSRFWFSKGNAPLDAGKQVRWDWDMYGVSTLVDVKAIEENKRILIEWNGPDSPTSVEWTFTPKGADRTFVTIRNWGFHGKADAVVTEAMNSAAGFSLVLAGLKAFLEHGIELNLVADHDPDALVESWRR